MEGLISYDGKAITYNDMGAPINYMGATFTWDVKGNLTDIKTGNDTISYTYMSDGKRRTRNVNGKITEYHYNNGMLLSETTGDETLRYYYDSTGKVTSIGFKKGEEEERSYFFTRNVQGDIIKVEPHWKRRIFCWIGQRNMTCLHMDQRYIQIDREQRAKFCIFILVKQDIFRFMIDF